MIARTWLSALVTVGVLALQGSPPAHAQAPATPKPEAPAAVTPQAAAPPKPVVIQPRRFASPEEATQAFVAALRTGDIKVLVAIVGSEGRGIVASGDRVVDRQTQERFLKAYDEGHKLLTGDDRATLHVGADEWPFPVPLVKQGDRWHFDPRQGREEIIARRIGRNELYTIQTCLAYVDAQREYYEEDRDGDGLLEYASRFASTPGKRDGLYWTTKPGEPPSPLGDLVASARAAGYRKAERGPTPFHGYLYRILTAQGPAAPGGAYDYLVRGQMIAGFALVAFPAQYGVSGVMTFVVNHEGVVYQKDLGPKTRATALAIRTFNPDSTWEKAEVVEVTASQP